MQTKKPSPTKRKTFLWLIYQSENLFLFFPNSDEFNQMKRACTEVQALDGSLFNLQKRRFKQHMYIFSNIQTNYAEYKSTVECTDEKIKYVKTC